MVRILKILLVVFIVALLLKSFIVEAFKIPSSSMQNTLLSGDFILVNKLAYSFSFPPKIPFTGSRISRTSVYPISKPEFYDVIAFEMPVSYFEINSDKYKVLVKRIVGLPGDTLQIKEHELFINKEKKRNPSYIKVFLSPDHLIKPDEPLFPFNDNKWTLHNYGPIVIPRKGMTVELTPKNILFWQAAINAEYDEKVISVEGSVINLYSSPIREYTFKHDHYFVLGDNRHNSIDSRFFGFVKDEWIIGKASIVYWSSNPESTNGILGYFNSIRFSRLTQSIE